jgi:hypothetical protein
MNQDIVAEEEKIVAKIFEVSNLNDISCIACAYPAQFIDAQEEAGLSRTITFVNTWEKDEMKKVFPAIVIFDELISLKENGKPLSCLCR